MGGIASLFQFKAYKIDRVKMDTQPTLDVLGLSATSAGVEWKLDLAIRSPQYFAKEKCYVGGLDATMALFPVGSRVVAIADEERKLVNLEMGVAGFFTVADQRFEPAVEENLVRIQIPALLLPYLRGAMTTLLANGGFGSIMLPLINIHRVAEEQLKGQEIQVVE